KPLARAGDHSRCHPPKGWFVFRSSFPQLKPKAAALAGRRVQPHAPAHAFDALLDDGQTDARARMAPTVQPGKNPENLLLMFRRNADAIVLHTDTDKAGGDDIVRILPASEGS